MLFTSQGIGIGGGGGVHVSIKNHDGKKPQEPASRPFFCLCFLMKKIAYGSSSARMKIRTARDLWKPVRVSTIFFFNFFKFFFLEGRGASDLSTLAASTKR